MKCYSLDDEEFNYTDIDSLFHDMESEGNLVIGHEYYEAECVHVSHEDYIDGYSILEQIDELIYDDTGECYNNDFASVSKEAKQELENLILEWAKRNVTLNYWKIKVKSVKKVITELDLF